MEQADYQIVWKRQFSENVYQMRIRAPQVAKSRKAGQFVLLGVDGTYGERIPLTISNASPEEGWVEIIFQKVGLTTGILAEMEVGQKLAFLLGPLGRPTHVTQRGHVVCVGGGIGVAPLYPIARAFKDAGNKVTVIIGARTRELVILEDEMREFADEVIVVTDDGSYGRKGVVTVPLKELCESADAPQEVIAIGPPIMMKFCVETVRPFEAIDVVCSLNSIMVDGTGMCGGCRVKIGDQTKFVCVDGPEFDGRLVDFNGLMKRLGAFKPQEQEKQTHHICRVTGMPAKMR